MAYGHEGAVIRKSNSFIREHFRSTLDIHQGVDLDMGYAADTMNNLFKVWKRPISISTTVEDREALYTFDGKELKESK